MYYVTGRVASTKEKFNGRAIGSAREKVRVKNES